MVELTLIGTDFRDVAPSELRVLSERTEQIRARLVELREQGALRGAVLLSTCNRVEALLDVDETSPIRTDLPRAVLGCGSEFPLHRHEGAASVRHLLRVAAGLESMVLGEEQILGQVGRAFQTAEELGLMSKPLHMLRTRLLQAARDLRNRNGLGRARSVAALAADWLLAAGPRLAVVGAGETGRLALDVLRRRGATDVLIVNRTLARAEALAQHMAGQPAGAEPMNVRACSLAAFLQDRPPLDGILFAVQSPNLLLDPDAAQGLTRVVDISQPSVLDPRLREVPGLQVCDLDDLASIAADEARILREAADVGATQAAARADAIWQDIQSQRADLGRVVDLHVETALAELDRAIRGPLRHLADADQEALRRVLEKAARRHAHFHVTDIRKLQSEPLEACAMR
ncbi:MAG: hypothetical protein IPM29_01535 [Planctomycetes bacterium]|nr:hypothetical protein [Planctomycetota bacterium]